MATSKFLDDPISVILVSRPVGPEINAAESLSLSCLASGGTSVYSYQWSSTCTSGCFLNSRSVIIPTATRDAARSTDSGLYTCTVTDNAGNSGTNSTEVDVVGKIIATVTLVYSVSHVCLHDYTGVGFFISGLGNIPNNSILETDSGGRISPLLCLSGSNMSTVGEWLSPEGRNLAAVPNDPFDIMFGGNPGQLLIETPTSNPPIMTSHEGVYTCVIPDENGDSQDLHIGIYLTASMFAEVL